MTWTLHTATRWLILSASAGLGLTFAGCSSALGPAPASTAIVLDRSLPQSQRTRAIEELPLTGPGRAEVAATMNVVVWSDRHPLGLRVAAMDRLRKHDAEAFWASADRWLATVDDRAMLAAIGQRVVDQDRRELIPAWLLRWAKPAAHLPESSRVEYRVFRRLVQPVSVEDALWQRLSDPAVEVSNAWAAWTVLCRLESEPTRRARLAEAQSVSPLIDDLRAAAVALDRLPTTAEGLRWLGYWRSDDARWARVMESSASIDADGQELRHLAVLSRLPRAVAVTPQHELREQLTARFANTDRIRRDVPAGNEIAWDTLGPLAWPDLAVVWSVAEAMQNVAVARAWFAQADADLADETTEYGGVLSWAGDDVWVARAFTPRHREGDRKFFSSPDMIEAMYVGLAHYHFHAQRHDNAEYAGPGRGDLAFTDAMETHTLTLTFVDRDRLNVDLAFPGGVVLDLGCIDRPTSD